MVSKNELRVGFKFEADTSQLELSKQKLGEITNSLKDIQNEAKQLKIMGKSTEEIEKAANEAKKLEQILNQSWNSKLGQLDLSKFNNNLKASNIDVQSMRNTLAQAGTVGVQAFNNIASSVLNTNTQLKQSSTLLNKMALTMANTIRFGISSSIFNNLTGSISKAYDYVKKLDKSLNDIRIVSDASASDMERFAQYANAAAKDLGSSTLDYTKGALIYFQQGLDEKSVKERTDITIKMAHVTESTAQEVSDYMTAIWNNFAKGSTNLEYYADVLAKLGAETASSAEEISQGLEKFAAISDTVGLSYEYAAAALTTVTDRTRQSADVVGTAFKTLFARIQDLELGKTLDDGTTLGKYSEALEKVGVNIKDQKGELKDMDTILNEMGEKWKSLSSDQKVALAQNVAGVRQYTQLMSLMENWDFFQQNVESARNATGTLQEQQEIYLESTEAHLQKLSTEAQKTYSILFDTDTINSFADALTGVLGLFNSFLSAFGGGLSTITTFAGVLTTAFNKQIGGAIERQIENFEVWKANLNAEELKQKFAEEITNGYTIEGKNLDINSTQVQKEAEVAAQIARLKESITQEEYNQLTIMQKQMGESAQKLEDANNYKSLLEGIFNDEEVSLSTMKKKANEIKSQTQEYEEQQVLIEEMQEAILDIENAPADHDDTWLDKLIELEGPGTQALQLTKEEMEQIYNILSDPTKDNAAAWEILEEKAQGVNDKLEEQYKKEEDINEAIRRREFLNSEEYKNLEEQLKERQRLLDQMEEQAKRQKMISSGVRALGSAVSLITSVSGAFKTLNEEGLTTGERVKRLASSLVIIIPTTMNLVKSLKTLIATSKLAGLTATEMWAQFLGPALLVVAALAAVGVAIYAIYKKQHELDDELKNAKEAAKQAREELEGLKTSYQELKDNISNYKEMEEALKKLTKGTAEWQEKLLEINDLVLTLLDKYPELIDYIDTSSPEGYLKIRPEGFEKVQENQRQKILDKQVFQVSSNVQVEEAQKKIASRDFLKKLDFDINLLSNADLEKVATAISQNTDDILKGSTEEIERALKESGLNTEEIEKIIPDLSKNIKDQLNAVSNFNSSMNLYTQKVGSYTQTLAGIINSSNPNYQKSDNKKYIDKETGKQYQEYYDNALARLNDKEQTDNDKIMQQYLAYFGEEFDHIWYKLINKNKGFYIGESADKNKYISYDYAKQELASKLAEDRLALDTDDIINKIDTFITNLNDYEGGAGNGKSDLGDFLKHIAANEDVTKLYTESELQHLQDVWETYARLNLKPAESPTDIKDENGNILRKKGEDLNQEHRTNFEDFFGVSLDEFSNKIGDALLHPRSDKEVLTDRAKKEKQSFREKSDVEAENLEANADGFYEYTQQLIDNSKALKENDEFAIIASKHHYELAEKLKTLHTNIKDNTDILKKWKKGLEVTPEEMEKIGETITSVRDILGQDVSEDFVKKHLEDIIKLSKGDISVLDDLQKAMAQDYILDIKGVDKVKDLPSDLQTLVNSINNLNLEDIEIGTKLNTNIEGQIQDLLDKCEITEEQANTILSGIGYNPKIDQVEAQISDANGETATLTYTDPETLEKKTITNYATTQMDGVISIPVINAGETRFKGATKNNFKWKPPKTDTGKNGGGKSKAKKQEKPKWQSDEIDRYHKINTQIEKVSNALTKLQKQEEKALGPKLLDNLSKQWKQLSTQVDNYKTKLGIAQGEYRELQKSLSAKGVQFNDDGTVSNYAEALKQQEKNYKKVYDWYYDKLSAKDQEKKKNKEKLEAAKEAYEKFKKEIDRIDTLASSEIPNIVQAMHDAIDEEIETNIKAFSLEVDLSLDLKQAQQQWNEFKHKVQNGLRDEDILGNAKLTQNNLGTLLSKDENGKYSGDLVNQIDHVQEILGQIELQKQNLANVYGDNTKAALDDLKKYFEEAQNSYKAAIEYQKELHQDYLNMLDQAKEKLDSQKEDYEQITNLLEHDKRLVELTYGEKAYAILDKYYKLQKQNNKDELQVLANQEKYYKARMEDAQTEMAAAKAALNAENLTADEYERRNSQYLATVEKFEKTKEHWTAAVEASNAMLETSIEQAQQSLENTLNLINQSLAQGLTGKAGGLDYAEEEWDLINDNADQYLDTINRLQGENSLESKYLESIEKATNPNIQKKLKNAMDSEMKALREKDKLTQYDLDRANKKYQITLAQLALEEAQQNKNKMRLRRDSQGNYRYQYVADDNQIQKAKEELSTLYTDLYNFDKDRYKSTLSEIEETTREFQEKLAELAKINDPQERLEKEQLLREQYQELFTAIQEEAETARLNLTDSAFDDLSFLQNKNKDEFLAMTEEETNALMTSLVPAWDSVYAAIAQNLEPLDFITESLGRQQTAWEETQVEIDDYLHILDKSREKIAQATDEVGKSIDEDIKKVEEFIESNEDLISTYESNLSSLEDLIDNTDDLIEGYKTEIENIGTLTKAYEELENQMQSNLATYDEYANRPTLVTDPNVGNVDETPGGTESQEDNSNEENTEGQQPKAATITDKFTYPKDFKTFKKNKTYVKKLQQFLKALGYNLGTTGKKKDGVDGSYGTKTSTAVAAFQAAELGFTGSQITGSFGPGTYKKAKELGFDTGGYTGEWGNNGRLAFLHQKELVLNAKDTENILNTVAIMRNLMLSMNENILSRLAGVSAGTVKGLSNGISNSGIEQNVHIDATFPNATNSSEIEEALRNLVNVASQRITK